MAKRKRLSPAIFASETDTSPICEGRDESRPPIASVVGDAAETSALSEVARTLALAREEGRLIQKLPLGKIEIEHLVRDRIAFDRDELEILKASLSARGQQVPIEVVALDDEQFGLISGLRRVVALREIEADEVLALVRQPESSAAAYMAMVEENEIRAGISFYERARLAAKAAELKLFETPHLAIAHLFASASASRRSKIGSFVRLYDELNDHLRYPAAIPERLGLALVGTLEKPGFKDELISSLREANPQDPKGERAVLEDSIKPVSRPRVVTPEIISGVYMVVKKGRVVLSGPGVTEVLHRELEVWLRAR